MECCDGTLSSSSRLRSCLSCSVCRAHEGRQSQVCPLLLLLLPLRQRHAEGGRRSTALTDDEACVRACGRANSTEDHSSQQLAKKALGSSGSRSPGSRDSNSNFCSYWRNFAFYFAKKEKFKKMRNSKHYFFKNNIAKKRN